MKITLDLLCGFAQVAQMQAVMVQVSVFDSEQTGRVVRAERLGVGMTLDQLSEKTGIHVSQLSRLENGRDDWTEEKFTAVKKAIEGNGKAVVL